MVEKTKYKYQHGQIVTINLGHGFTTVAKLMSKDACLGNPPTWFVQMAGEAQIHEDDMIGDIPEEHWPFF